MAKETRLNDNADIYAKRNIQSEKQKFREMNTIEKLHYFKDYYLMKLIIIGMIIGISIWIIYTILSPRDETILYTAIVNDSIAPEKTDELTKELETYFNITSPKQNIVIDANFIIDPENITSHTIASEQKLSTYIFAKQIDVIIANEEFFANYARFGYFADLADLLPTNLYSYLSDSFYISDTDENKDLNAYGIYLTDNKKYKELDSILEKPVLGIVVNSKYRNNAVDFIEYLNDFN